MKFETVTAFAFGPFRDRQLQFSPSMNILYGPNEIGKSTWHAAIFAGLCGVRRGKGSRSSEDMRFADRHKPWNGGGWRVGAVINLDTDGRRIELVHDLEGRVGSRVFDAVLAGRDYQNEVINDGSPDGARFLGLDRHSFLATACIRQSEILGVLENPQALQQHLQRAAASTAADGTAAEALRRIDSFRRDHVGFERRHAIGPLQKAIDRAEAARQRIALIQSNRRHIEELAERVDAREKLLHSRVDTRKAAEAAISSAEALSRQERYECARDLSSDFPLGAPEDLPTDDATAQGISAALTLWAQKPTIPNLVGETAEELSRGIAALPSTPIGDTLPDEEVIQASAALQSLGDIDQVAPEGDNVPDPDVMSAYASFQTLALAPVSSVIDVPSATELAAEIDTLPGAVLGDVVADSEVVNADAVLSAVRLSQERHKTGEPTIPDWPDLGGLQEDDVIRLRDVLRESQASDQIESPIYTRPSYNRLTTNVAPRNDDRPSVVRSIVALSVLLATVVAVVMQIWWVAGTAGILLMLLVYLWRERIPGEIGRLIGRDQFGPVDSGAGADPVVDDRTQDARASALRQLTSLGLPVEVEGLTRLIEQHRAAQRIAPRREEWVRRKEELANDLRGAKERLRSALLARGVSEIEDLDNAVAEYRAACVERASLAVMEARRSDLERRLMDRRQTEYEATEIARRFQSAETRLAESLVARGVPLADGLTVAVTEYRVSCAENADRAHVFAKAEHERRSARERLSAALRARGAPISEDPRASFENYVDSCLRRAPIALEAARRPDLERQRDDRRRAEIAEQGIRQTVATLGTRLRDLAREQCGVEMEPDRAFEALSDWIRTRGQNLHMFEERRARWASLQAILGGETLGIVSESARQSRQRANADQATCSPEAFTIATHASDPAAYLRTCRDAENQALDAVAQDRGQLGERRRAVASIVEDEEELQVAQDEISRLRELASTLSTAERLLTEAQESIHRTIAPKLAAAIGARLGKITSGRYKDVKVDPQSLAVDVRAPDGAWRNAGLLSHGTAEQVYLLLRVALSEHLATSGEPCPLILDDVTVQSDARRTVEILEALHVLSADRQVILFTQEEDVRDWARNRLDDSRDSFVELTT